MEGEGADSEPVKPQKEESTHAASQARESAAEQRMVANIASQPQSPTQLKSCLKKPSGDEGGNGGGGRGARVKFVLGGGEENSKGEVPLNENKKKQDCKFSKI